MSHDFGSITQKCLRQGFMFFAEQQVIAADAWIIIEGHINLALSRSYRSFEYILIGGGYLDSPFLRKNPDAVHVDDLSVFCAKQVTSAPRLSRQPWPPAICGNGVAPKEVLLGR